MTKIQEGYMPFGEYKTYYRIVGKESDKAPLLLLHGGPGSTHNYFELLDDLAEKDHRQLIMYDQIGCGRSSMPDDKAKEIYNAKTWVAELKALREYLELEQIHVLGQSWGGMLEIIYLCDEQPKGIKSGILASTLPASWMWDKELHRMIKFMDPADQKAIEDAEAKNDFTSPAYQRANTKFMELHCNSAPTSADPEPLRLMRMVFKSVSSVLPKVTLTKMLCGAVRVPLTRAKLCLLLTQLFRLVRTVNVVDRVVPMKQPT